MSGMGSSKDHKNGAPGNGHLEGRRMTDQAEQDCKQFASLHSHDVTQV